jgi:hypothetical protein
LVEEHMMSKK